VFVALSSSQLGGKHFADDEEVEMEAQKWLRQQSKDSYAADFDAMVKRWDECIIVGGGYVEKYHTFYISYPFVAYLLTPPCTCPRTLTSSVGVSTRSLSTSYP
jgi:hypothetical protein